MPELLEATFIDPLYELAVELTEARNETDFAFGGTAAAMDSGVKEACDVELLSTETLNMPTDRSV